jgi:hypothetical protein
VERLPALNVLDGSAFVLSERHGDVDAQRGLEGFFWEDTRVISRFRLLVDGREPELLSTADVDSFAAQAFLVPPSDSIYDNPQLSIMRRRLVRGTWLEELLLVNHRHDARVVRLRIDVDADFADLFEVKDDEVRRRHVDRELAAIERAAANAFAERAVESALQVVQRAGHVSASRWCWCGGSSPAAG